MIFLKELVRRTYNDTVNDFEPATGSISIKYPLDPKTGFSDRIQYDTNILMDTGLSNMIIAIPGKKRQELPVGTQIKVFLPGNHSYSFITGSDSIGSPSRATLTGSLNERNNLNTGLHAFQLFDYLYDADRGILGLRRR